MMNEQQYKREREKVAVQYYTFYTGEKTKV